MSKDADREDRRSDANTRLNGGRVTGRKRSAMADVEPFDLVVIGSGPAGEKGAVQAAYFGKRVAVVEKSPALGGACVNTGTLPSKTLRETALFLSGYRQREMYGLRCGIEGAPSVPEL